ncbi:hypothetical protein ACFO0N_17695 [Halobium salinum]|uniref:Uncharacterized protein n=1 Tax=Halobium salinum TaxID=1364940 RepID=A0ABD5PG20_9EURY|nr:hypothetical protein [Halobium salinum]
MPLLKAALFVGYVLAVGAALLRSGSSLGLTLGYLLICLAVLAVLSGTASFVRERLAP